MTTSGAFWQTNFSALDADYASRFFSPTIPDDPSFTELKFTGACLPFSVFAIPTVLLGVGIPSEEAFGMGVFFFPSASAEPLFDTIRGGSLIVLHGDVALVDETQDVVFKAQILPSGWTNLTSGSGSVKADMHGAVLSTGQTSASSAKISSGVSYDSFEATMNVSLLSPDKNGVAALASLIFEFRIDSTHYVQLRLRRDPIVSDLLISDSLIVVPDESKQSGARLLSTVEVLKEIEVKITRFQNYVFLHVNGVLVGSTERFDVGLGTLSFEVLNGASGRKVVTRLNDMKVRSQAIISGRLIRAKQDKSKNRVAGLIPAATLTEVGFHDLFIFGPWGSTTIEDGFEYILPEGRSLTHGPGTTNLKMYSDGRVRD